MYVPFMKDNNSGMEEMMSTAEDTLQKLGTRFQQTVNRLAERIAESSEDVLTMADNTQTSAQRLAVERAKFRFTTRLQEAGFQYLLEIEEKASELEERLQKLPEGSAGRRFLEGQLESVRQTRGDLINKALQIDSNMLIAAASEAVIIPEYKPKATPIPEPPPEPPVTEGKISEMPPSSISPFPVAYTPVAEYQDPTHVRRTESFMRAQII
jgi:hypothetical protein